MKGLRLGLSLTGSRFNPLSLFAGGAAGAWYDPSDLSTLFQDSAATTPVTAADDPVGCILDKSGNGHHLIQATADNRPLYKVDSNGKPYLLFDGISDGLGIVAAVCTIPFDRISAIRQVTWTANDRIFGGAVGAALMQSGTTPNIRIYDGNAAGGTTGLTLDTNGVVTERHIANASQVAVNNGAYNTADCGTTNLTQMVIGAQNTGVSTPSNIRFYGLVMRSGTMTDAQIANSRVHMAAKAGVAL